MLGLRREQKKDPDLAIILNLLTGKVEPSEGELFLASPAAKFYWINKERCLLIEGVLYCYDKQDQHPCLVLPESLKELGLEMNHDLPSAGHQGVARTKLRLKEKFLWFGMTSDIERYVLGCSVCNQNKKTGRFGRYPFTEYHAGAPMERVHIETSWAFYLKLQVEMNIY